MEEILKKLIELFFTYSENKNAKNLNLTEFVGFLNVELGEQGKSNEKTSKPNSKSYNTETDDLGILLVLLNRYAKEYVKKALKDTPLSTADEFPFLISLLGTNSHTKTELINKMVLTKTSGTEVIKRLLKKGFIEEFEDANDKRSIRVKLTEEGKLLTLGMLPKMQMVSEIIKGGLSSTELTTLNYLLRKLEKHHKNIYEESGDVELKELLSNK
ncbi:MAG: MarR family winged helix-turn-helix transcriptional regulator [Fulvivirga sp.]|uniref:MarR family winged helix-turn-helix transcriptional regulator n=1 Tax=Fulvivirga sp. TaxID=1931237 RepID=UPI0032ECC9EF